jgi:hypothetical protein
VSRKEWSKVRRDTNGANARPATTMGDAESFVQVQMADIGANNLNGNDVSSQWSRPLSVNKCFHNTQQIDNSPRD